MGNYNHTGKIIVNNKDMVIAIPTPLDISNVVVLGTNYTKVRFEDMPIEWRGKNLTFWLQVEDGKEGLRWTRKNNII